MEKKYDKELIPNLFRSEYSKMVSVLCRSFGLSNIEFAEDIVSDTFLKASETWGLKGIPENPTAWIYTVAKNRAKDQFKRNAIFNKKITPYLIYDQQASEELNIDFSEDFLNDSLLQMMFSVCNPLLNLEAQLSLGLRVLCGFSIDEIANALLTSKSTINKRLVRAKEKFRNQNITLEFPPPSEIDSRQGSVLLLLYLLFNEGYFSTHASNKIRRDLCFDAMRLTHLLTQNEKTNTPDTNAILALFCFHASRFDARTDELGNQILYDDQDQEKWNFDLISKGEQYLSMSSSDNKFSKYQLESLIAYWHTRRNLNEKERWLNILRLFDRLVQIENSPMAILNRIFAVAKVHGKTQAIMELKKIKLKENPLYHSLLAELYHPDSPVLEIHHLQKAIELTNSEKDKLVLQKKLDTVSHASN